MNELAPRTPIPPPAEIVHPKQAEIGMRHDLAILDVMRRGKAGLVEQMEVLSRVIQYAYEGMRLIKDMRRQGKLAENHDGRSVAELRRQSILTLADLELVPGDGGLKANRVSEWASLVNHDAEAFVADVLANVDQRDTTLRKASVNWIRERVEQLARLRQAEQRETTQPAYDYEIRHGDLRTALDDLAGQVDVIITDPPYPVEYLDEYDALSEVAARILKPDGMLVAMVGQTHLPDYLERLSRHMTYRWCMAYLTEGRYLRVFGRSVATGWKPLLIYDRGGDRQFLTQDIFKSAGREKLIDAQIDGWSQSESGMLDIVERLSLPGQLVVDPFLGAGTTAVACHKLGRRFIGCDVSADAVLATRKRLAQ